jgi:hypothetical protein
LRAVVDLTGELLSQAAGAALTRDVLRLWTLRLQSLVALDQLHLCQQELEAFAELDAPDLYEQYYPQVYPASQGCSLASFLLRRQLTDTRSLVPFSLRIVHAEMAPPLIATRRCQQLIKRVKHVSWTNPCLAVLIGVRYTYLAAIFNLNWRQN